MENRSTKDVTASLEENYRARTPRSQELFERARKTMPGGAKGAYFHQPYPLTMACGEGCYLYDVEGQRYVDFANHHTAQVLGHNHPAFIDAIEKQMAKGHCVRCAGRDRSRIMRGDVPPGGIPRSDPILQLRHRSDTTRHTASARRQRTGKNRKV